MSRPRRVSRSRSQPREQLSVTILWIVFAAGLVLVPLWVSVAGRDPFRVPKIALFRGEGLLLSAIIVGLLILGDEEWHDALIRMRGLLALAGVAIAWTAVAALASSEPLMSVPSLVTLLAATGTFLAAAGFADRRRVVPILLFAPLVVACVAIIQVHDEWNRAIVTWMLGGYDEARLPRVSPISLLGNRNDVGSFLVAPALLAFALAVTARNRKRRLLFFAAFAILVSGMVAANTMTAIAAFVAALFVAAALRSWKVAAAAVVVSLIAFGATYSTYEPFQARVVQVANDARRGQWDRFLTFRLAAFLSAAEMARDNPATGVGPGHFKKEYFDYKIAAAARYPELLPGGGSTDIFEDAHNDHLQVAAETGVPGVLIFNASLAALAWISVRRRPIRHDPVPNEANGLTEAARVLALPLALSIFVLAIGQNPLRLAVTIQACAAIAGLTAAWSRDD